MAALDKLHGLGTRLNEFKIDTDFINLLKMLRKTIF